LELRNNRGFRTVHGGHSMSSRGNTRIVLRSQIVYESFPAEVLAINLDTGTYYSLTGSSVGLWPLIIAGGTAEGIVSAFLAAHEGDPVTMEATVHAFLTRLEDERLIETGPVTDSYSEQAVAVDAKQPFEPFEMHVFTDMQDLLLLDPVHDSEETGWPLAKANASGAEH
jgi:hypothetical protein